MSVFFSGRGTERKNVNKLIVWIINDGNIRTYNNFNRLCDDENKIGRHRHNRTIKWKIHWIFVDFRMRKEKYTWIKPLKRLNTIITAICDSNSLQHFITENQWRKDFEVHHRRRRLDFIDLRRDISKRRREFCFRIVLVDFVFRISAREYCSLFSTVGKRLLF